LMIVTRDFRVHSSTNPSQAPNRAIPSPTCAAGPHLACVSKLVHTDRPMGRKVTASPRAPPSNECKTCTIAQRRLHLVANDRGETRVSSSSRTTLSNEEVACRCAWHAQLGWHPHACVGMFTWARIARLQVHGHTSVAMPPELPPFWGLRHKQAASA
jgi:hypothetical protein